MKLSGKTVLITGASSGLGRSLALAAADGGCRLIVTARREARLQELAAEVRERGGQCLVVAADATDAGRCVEVIEQGIAEFGPIDVAVLNAGGGGATSMAETTAEQVLWEMRTNYDTLVAFLCPLMDHMKGRHTVIAYTGSPAGYFGLPRSGPYSAAKAAGRVLIDTCRIELRRSGIRFVAMYPGFTYTEGLNPDDVPSRLFIIDKEVAVRHMVRAIERERAHHMFPWFIRAAISLGRVLPEPIRRWVLQRAV